jgi:hypothetical protein
MATNKVVLNQGIKYFALPAMFIGPTIIHFAFINKQQTLYPFILIVGIATCLLGIFMIVKGLKTILKSIFNE